jgi:hypothetical protein
MSDTTAPERADLLEILRTRRGFLKRTVQRLTDEQAALTPTISELCLGGLIKHVTATEAEWCRFVLDGPGDGGLAWSEDAVEAYANQFRMLDGETLAGVLAAYDEAAARTDALVLSEDLDKRHPLPAAPWFEAGATRSVRQVFLHIATETAQHAGHADIIRESIDGQKSMG